jgi:hypothetical protein
MTDEVLYRHEMFPGPLVPYQCGLPCWHGLREAGEGTEAPFVLAAEAPPPGDAAAISA